MKRFYYFKFFAVFLCLCLCFLTGCESSTMVRTAFITDISGAMSTKYSIKVVLEKDDRVGEKYVDLQIKSDKENQKLTFGEENQKSYTLVLPKKDYWYNLTYLISQANGTKKEGQYVLYEDFGSKVFNFSSDNDFVATFRVVAGNTKKNQETGEEILVLSEDVSEEVSVEVKKCQET